MNLQEGQGIPEAPPQQPLSMEEQINQLQEQIDRLSASYQRQPQESKHHDNLRLYQGSLRSIPISSGE